MLDASPFTRSLPHPRPGPGAAILVVACATFLSACGARTPAIRAQGEARPVASLERVRLGGMDQAILMRGRADTLPVLLWVHGGPGAAQMQVGRHDWNTPLSLIAAYYEALDAPAGKRLVVFDHSVHTPFFGEPTRFNAAVTAAKLSLPAPSPGD